MSDTHRPVNPGAPLFFICLTSPMHSLAYFEYNGFGEESDRRIVEAILFIARVCLRTRCDTGDNVLIVRNSSWRGRKHYRLTIHPIPTEERLIISVQKRSGMLSPHPKAVKLQLPTELARHIFNDSKWKRNWLPSQGLKQVRDGLYGMMESVDLRELLTPDNALSFSTHVRDVHWERMSYTLTRPMSPRRSRSPPRRSRSPPKRSRSPPRRSRSPPEQSNALPSYNQVVRFERDPVFGRPGQLRKK